MKREGSSSSDLSGDGTASLVARWLSIRLVLTAALVVPTSVLAVGLILFGDSSARAISDALAEEAVKADRSALLTTVEKYLDDAREISDLYARLIRIGALDPGELGRWRERALQDVAISDQIASITFGRPDGATFWVVPVAEGFEYAMQEPGEPLREYAVDPEAPERMDFIRELPFTVVERPWYVAAVEADAQAWSEIYLWAGKEGADREVGMAYVRPIRDASGEFEGVLSIDITLGAVSDRLRSLSIANDRYILLADESGALIASSEGSVTDGTGTRLDLQQAGNRDRAAFSAIRIGNQTGMLRGEPARFNIRPITPAPGLDWQMVIGIPESVFLAEAQATRRRMIAISTVGTLIMLAIGLVIAASIVHRFHQLRDHVRALGAGRYEVRLPESGLPEWRELAFAMNGVAEQLGDAPAPSIGDRGERPDPVGENVPDGSSVAEHGAVMRSETIDAPPAAADYVPTVLCVKLRGEVSGRARRESAFENALADLEQLARDEGMRPIAAAGSMFVCVAPGDDLTTSGAASAASRLALHILERAHEGSEPERSWDLAVALASGPLRSRPSNGDHPERFFGEAIDIARALCDHGPAGVAQVHESTRRLIGNEFALTQRGRFLNEHRGIEHIFVLGGKSS